MNEKTKHYNNNKNGWFDMLFALFRLFVYIVTLFIFLKKNLLRFIIYKICISPISSQPKINFSNKNFKLIETKDFKMIISHFNPSDKEHKNIQLYFHANAESIYHCYQSFKQQCLKADVIMAFIEFPGENGLIKPFTKENVNQMAKKAIEYLKIENYSITKCIGFSIGTGVAVEVACKHEIPSLILIAPYYNLSDLINFHLGLKGGYLKNLLDGVMLEYFGFDTENTLRGYKGNLTLYHGKKDKVIPYDHSERLINANYDFPSALYSNRLYNNHNTIHYLFFKKYFNNQ